MMEVVRTSETSVDNHFTRQYTPEDNSEHNQLIFVIEKCYVFFEERSELINTFSTGFGFGVKVVRRLTALGILRQIASCRSRV
jgi:hypothetical protein